MSAPLIAVTASPAAPVDGDLLLVTQTSSGGGFALGPAAYISGICLLVAVALCLIVVACVLRRKDRRHMAALRAQQDAALAAAQLAADAEAARRAAHPVTIPVVIVQPDGQFELAEELKDEGRKGSLELVDLEGQQAAEEDKPAALPPIGFRPTQQ